MTEPTTQATAAAELQEELLYETAGYWRETAERWIQAHHELADERDEAVKEVLALRAAAREAVEQRAVIAAARLVLRDHEKGRWVANDDDRIHPDRRRAAKQHIAQLDTALRAATADSSATGAA